MKEVLDAPNVMNMIKDTKAAQEVNKIQIFYFYFHLILTHALLLKSPHILRKSSASIKIRTKYVLKHAKRASIVDLKTFNDEHVSSDLIQVRALGEFFSMLSNVSF